MLRNSLAMALLAAALISGCGSSTPQASQSASSSTPPSPTATQDPSTTTAASRDCPVAQAPVPSSVDAVLTSPPGYTVVEACASDSYPSFAHLEEQAKFYALTSGIVEQNGAPVLKFIAGQLNSGSGDAYLQSFFSELSADYAELNPPKTVAVEPTPQAIGGFQVTYFNVQLETAGYAYAQGSNVVIANIQLGEDAAGKDVLPKILANLH